MAEWLRRLTNETRHFLLEGRNKPEVLFIFYFSHLSKKTFRQSDMYRTLGETIWSDPITWPVYPHTWLNYRQFQPLSTSAVCKSPKSISQSNPTDVIQRLLANQMYFRFKTLPFFANKPPSPLDTCIAEKYLMTSGVAWRATPRIGFIIDISQRYKCQSKRF